MGESVLVLRRLPGGSPQTPLDRPSSAPAGLIDRLLQVLVVATVALAPNEGYLLAIHGQLGKVAPGLLVAVWLLRLLGQRRLPVRHPVHGLLAAFATVVVASTAVNVGLQPYALSYLIRWLPFLAITVVLIDLVSRQIDVRLVLLAAVAGSTVASVGAVYSFLFLGDERATGPMDDPNDLAYVLVAALPLMVAFVPATRRPRWLLPAAVAVTLLLALGAAATLSRGGAIALLVAGTWLGLRRAVPLKIIIGVVAGIGLALVVAYAVAQPVVMSALGQKSFVASSNVDDRTVRWEAAAKMLAAQPVLGVGPGGFRHHYTPVSHNAEPAEQTPVAHNMYLEVAAELGLVGFAAFVAVIAASFVATERALRRGADPPVVFGVQASLLAVLVASAFLSEQYYTALWSMIAIGCALQLRTTVSKP